MTGLAGVGFVLLLAFAALGSIPCGALAVPAPDAARLAALQAEFGSHARVRLGAGGESFVLNECRLDSAGVKGVRGIDAPGAISAARLEAREIPWAGIDELARYHSRAGRGVLWGATMGLASGIAIAATLPRYPSNEDHVNYNDPTAYERAMAVAVGTVMGGLLGGLGGFVLPSWQRVWPAPGATARAQSPVASKPAQ